MNKYLMGITHYFSGEKTFEIEADSKKDAIVKGNTFVQTSPLFSGNCKMDTLRCIKKLRK